MNISRSIPAKSMVFGCGIAALIGLFAVLSSHAADAADKDTDGVRKKLAAVFKVPVDEVRPSPVPGLYEIRHHHDIGYASADGRYLLQGDLVDLKTGAQLTEQTRRAERRAAVDALGEQNTIEFAPAAPIKTQYTVTVFTDVDCGYCRLLHSQITDYNAKGIAIRYAFFPRTGPDSPSWYAAESVWCSSDRKAALTKAKLGAKVPSKTCSNPIQREYQLGGDIGVRATPALVLPSGELVLGVISPDELAEHLKQGDKAPALSMN